MDVLCCLAPQKMVRKKNIQYNQITIYMSQKQESPNLKIRGAPNMNLSLKEKDSLWMKNYNIRYNK